MEDIRTCCIQLLVAEDGQLCGRLCERLWPLQLHKILSSIPHRQAHAQSDPWSLLAAHLGWSDNRTAPKPRLQCHYDGSWSSIQWDHIIPTTSDITATGEAQLYQDHVWKLHGLPEEVISDQGMQFILSFTQSLSHILGIWVAASTDYHPQMDGQTKRVNQEVEKFLWFFVN